MVRLVDMMRIRHTVLPGQVGEEGIKEGDIIRQIAGAYRLHRIILRQEEAVGK